jgi:hypothetical protein
MSSRTVALRPLSFAFLLAGFAVLALVLPASSALAKKPPRVGGEVSVAWPKSKHGKPSQALARYLAEQVGARRGPARPRGPVTVRAARTAVGGTTGAATIPGGGALKEPLRLVRSFDIPRDDPAYARLLNVSFTYDSALAATAFATLKDRAQAEQLLDQLKALQRTDGSIEYAFDTLTGASDPHFWAGTIAWTGYAAEAYRSAFKNSRYGSVSDGVKDWLIAQQLPNGLIKGGPTVSWASALHNFVAWNFFTAYAANNSGSKRNEALAAASKIQNGIDNHLTVNDSSGLRFKQGLDDPIYALDAQALGIMHLLARGRTNEAGRVADYMNANFAISGQSIAKSADPLAFNGTYEAAGPFTGYRPYAGVADVPDVLWMEGTLEARMALAMLRRSTATLDGSISRWRAVTGTSVAPLMANRTLTSRFNEYHVWPVSATASWTLLGSSAGARSPATARLP